MPEVLQKEGARSTRPLCSTARRSPPSPLAHPLLQAAGARQCPRARPQSTAPRAGGGPESSSAGARHGRPLLIGRPRPSRAGRTGIGAARGQSWSNWTLGGGSQSQSSRGWRRRRAQSPGWEPGRDARTMPYVLISTQIRVVSTRRPASWDGVGWGRARARAEGAATAPWRLPLGQRPPVTGPGSRPGHAPSGRGSEAGERTQPGSRDSGSSGRPVLPVPRSGWGACVPAAEWARGACGSCPTCPPEEARKPWPHVCSTHCPTQSSSAGVTGWVGGSGNILGERGLEKKRTC